MQNKSYIKLILTVVSVPLNVTLRTCCWIIKLSLKSICDISDFGIAVWPNWTSTSSCTFCIYGTIYF